MAKPIVNGIEKELGNVRLVRLNVMSRQGVELARRFGARGVPTLLVLDGTGQTVLRQVGRLNKETVLSTVTRLQQTGGKDSDAHL